MLNPIQVFKCLVAALLLLAAVPGALAQADTGKIKGSIKDSGLGALPYANVMLRGTTLGAITSENGSFEIAKIPAGQYLLLVSSVGYESITRSVTIKPNETTVLHFTLKPGQRQLQAVVVESNRPFYAEVNPSQFLRINTPILELPQNIQIINKEVLADQQAFDMLEGVQRNVSGAQRVEHWDTYARINMRGSQLTSFRNGMNVQISPWSPLTEDMSMVDRIEFVKGPAGFMLASGEPSGFYNVVTKKPSGKEKGEASFTLGSFGHYRATADLDGKLSKNGKLLYRFNLMGQLKGSHRKYEYNNRYTIAPVLKYFLSDRTAFTLEYSHQYSQMNVIGSNYSFSKKGYGVLPVNFTTAEPNLKPTEIADKSLMGVFEHAFNDQWKVTAQAAYFDHNQVGQSLWPRKISAVNDSLMQRGISIWDALGVNKTAQAFLNGKASTAGIQHNILTGVDLSHKDYYADWNQAAALGDSTFNIYAPRYGQEASAELPVWDRSKDVRDRGVHYNNSYMGLYFQDELGFWNNKVRLTLAGRYTGNKYINPYSGTSTDGKFTPRLGLSYSISKSTSTYFVYDQAFLANPGADWQGKNFDPVTGENLEAGLKKDWLDGRWNMAFSAYQITKNNVLTTDLEHAHPETGQFVYRRQTGQQQVKGVEVDVKGELLPNLGVVLNYAYTDARITRDSNPQLVGNQVPGATRHIQNSWLSYKISEGNLAGLKFSLGYQYQAGRSSWFVFDNSENALPDYFRMDGGLGYRKKKISVNVLVNNLLNTYLYSGAPYFGTYYWQTEPKRNVRLTLGYRF